MVLGLLSFSFPVIPREAETDPPVAVEYIAPLPPGASLETGQLASLASDRFSYPVIDRSQVALDLSLSEIAVVVSLARW